MRRGLDGFVAATDSAWARGAIPLVRGVGGSPRSTLRSSQGSIIAFSSHTAGGLTFLAIFVALGLGFVAGFLDAYATSSSASAEVEHRPGAPHPPDEADRLPDCLWG